MNKTVFDGMTHKLPVRVRDPPQMYMINNCLTHMPCSWFYSTDQPNQNNTEPCSRKILSCWRVDCR